MIRRLLAATVCAAAPLSVALAQETPAPAALKQTTLLSFPFGQTPSSGLTVGPGNAVFGAAGSKIYELYQDESDIWRTRVIYDATQTAVTGVIQLEYAKDELYGLSTFGAANCSRFSGPGCGFLFTLKPTSNPAVWERTALYEFPGDRDGRYPVGFAFDPKGDLIVSTREGGGSKKCGAASGEPNGCGTLMRLSRTARGFKAQTLARFASLKAGGKPDVGPSVDEAAHIYQAMPFGDAKFSGSALQKEGNGTGVVIEYFKEEKYEEIYAWEPVGLNESEAQFLSATRFALAFGDRSRDEPISAAAKPRPASLALGAIVDAGKPNCDTFGETRCGVVFYLERPARKGAKWSYREIHRFAGNDGDMPVGGWLAVGKSFYGVTRFGGTCAATTDGCGVVYRVKRTETGWKYDGTAHRFAGGTTDGRQPLDQMVEIGGKIFGVTRFGGSADAGVAYMLEK